MEGAGGLAGAIGTRRDCPRFAVMVKILIGRQLWHLQFSKETKLMCRKLQAVVFALMVFGPLLAVERRQFEKAPLVIEPNRGQWDSSVRFGAHGTGFTATFEGSGITYNFSNNDKTARVKMRWLGSANAPLMTPLDGMPGISNYYLGNDPSRWVTEVPNYGRLRMESIYKGIDLVYYGRGREVEYDLVVAPGADPRLIRLSFEGAVSRRINEVGDLIVATGVGELVQRKPNVYQGSGAQRTVVAASYELRKDDVVGIALGTYDKTRQLVIDPVVAWGTSLGSGQNGGGTGKGVAVDSSGNVYVTGFTNASDFPVVSAYKSTLCNTSFCNSSKAFLTKFSPDGLTLIFSTYFGGSSNDSAYAIALDKTGNPYITGTTSSSDFPTKAAYNATASGLEDAFVAKFTTSGGLTYSTYIGGISIDIANAIAVDASGNAYITGSTSSSNFPAVGAYQTSLVGSSDAFVTKLAATGSTLIFSTFLGGNFGDVGNAIDLGPTGNIFVAGSTQSTTFPTKAAFQSAAGSVSQNGFLTQLDAAGSTLVYSTLFGSTALISGIAIDAAGSAFITGSVFGSIPIKNSIQPTIIPGNDGFIAKFAADGASLVYSNYLGASGSAIRIDTNGNATVVGTVISPNFPTVGAFNPRNQGQDGFITQFNANGTAITFSSFIGGNSSDRAFGLALDASGGFYVVGDSYSNDFPSAGSYKYTATPFVIKLTGSTTTVPVTFNTMPAGLNLIVDGFTFATPKTFQWAPSVTHQISALSPQSTAGPNVSNYLSWSHGGTQSQSLITPAAAANYTANFDNLTCVYSFSSPNVITGQLAGYSSVTVNTQAGCIWTPMSSVSWLTLNSGIQTGSQGFYYTFEANASGKSRTAIITVGGATFTVTQQNTVPVPSYVLPCCGPSSGLSGSFTFIFNDADGSADLSVSNILINNFLDGRVGCYLAFDHQGQVLYLVNDTGSSIAGMPFDANGQGSGVLSNSQCSVDGLRTAINRNTGSPTRVSLVVGLTFTGSFGGNKVIYIAARDKVGLNSGWIPAGTWNVTTGATYPNVTSSSNYVYNSLGTVTVAYRDLSNNLSLSPSQILIRDSIDGRSACYMGYDHVNNRLYLLNDTGSALLAAITPGVGTGTQQNSQCIIYANGSSVTQNGREYSLTVKVFFMPAFAGPKILYAATQTLTGGNSGWQAVGYFIVE